MSALVTAITSYRTEYNRMPLGEAGAADLTLESSGELIDILKTEVRHPKNPGAIQFYEPPPQYSSGARGSVALPDGSIEVRDPWGTPYKIILDLNGDGETENPEDGTRIRLKVAVYSAGPDQDYSTWKDNVASWE